MLVRGATVSHGHPFNCERTGLVQQDTGPESRRSTHSSSSQPGMSFVIQGPRAGGTYLPPSIVFPLCVTTRRLALVPNPNLDIGRQTLASLTSTIPRLSRLSKRRNRTPYRSIKKRIQRPNPPFAGTSPSQWPHPIRVPQGLATPTVESQTSTSLPQKGPRKMIQPPEPGNSTSISGITTEGSPAERIFRGFICGVFLGIALALFCACVMPCLPRG